MNELTPKILPIVPQSLKGNVLSQINKRKKIMKDIRNYSAIAAVVVAFIFMPIVLGNIKQAKATDFIEQSISESSDLKSLIIKYLMRNPLTYNPDVIELDSKMNEVTGKIIFNEPIVWKFENKNKWYIYDGERSYWYSKVYKDCIIRINMDTSDLGRFNAMFLKSSTILEAIKQLAKEKKANIEMQTNGDSIKLTLKYKVRSIDKSRFMMGDIFGWYNNNLKNSFLTDCRQVYVFNKENKLLKSFDISVYYNNKYLTILKSKSIEYNSNIDKEKIIEIPQNLNKRFLKSPLVNMTSKQAVKYILNDLKNDSTSTLINRTLFYGANEGIDYKKLYGLDILEIGEPYKTENYEGELVPVKIKLKNGEAKSLNIAVSQNKDKNKRNWLLDGGL